MPIMREFSELTLWEISHYWHGYSPNQTSPSKLPLEVEKTLRVLAGGASKGLYLRCPESSFHYKAFNEQAWALTAITAIYQKELRRVYYGRKFKKRFLDSLTMTRTAIAKWCLKTNTPAPAFWFEKDDPLLKKSIEELDTVAALSRDGLFKVLPLFIPNNNDLSINPNAQTQAVVSPESLSSLSIPAKENALKAEISRMARGNALAKYKSQHELKKNFIRFYYGNKYDNRTKAAKDFFEPLIYQDKIRLVPTYDEKAKAHSLDKAVRTLTTALREFESTQTPEWLNGFSL